MLRKTIGAILCAALFAFAVQAGDKPTIHWQWGSTTADTHPAVITAEMMAEALSRETNGRWTMDVYANSVIGNEQECIDMVRTGTLNICSTNLTTMEQFIPDFGVFALPYLFRSWDDYVQYVTTSKLCTDLLDNFEKGNKLHLFSLLLNGTRCLSTNKIPPIQRPSDLNGVKIRSMEAPVWQDIITALGGSAIPVNFSELYMALQTGVVNGQDNPIVLLYSNKFYEVLDNCYRTDHCYNTAVHWVNADDYNALDPEDKALFDRLNQEILHDKYDELMAAYNKEAEEGLTSHSVRIWEPDEFDIKAFYASADDMVNAKYLPNPVFRKYIEDIRKTFNYQ